MPNTPYGAIMSRDFVLHLMDRARAGEEVFIYHVWALGRESEISTYRILPETRLYSTSTAITGTPAELMKPVAGYIFDSKEYIDSTGVYIGTGDVFGRQLGNDHYYFEDIDLAECYKMFASTDPELLAKHDIHSAFCRMFEEFDDYDSFDEK